MPNGNKLSDTSELIQTSEPRYTDNELTDLMMRSVNGIGADIDKGISILDAIENNVTSQDWYPLLNDRQKRQFQSVIESTFEESIATLPSEQQEADEIGVDTQTKDLTDEIEKLYYEVRDGSRSERIRAKARIEQMLLVNPKLSYIYKNISLINEQLETRGLLTKSIGCP